jgi:hypothetical protein
LKVHDPDSEHLNTFAFRGRRLDWILISPELEFVDYRTLPETLSDHQAVVATLRLAPIAAGGSTARGATRPPLATNHSSPVPRR